MAAILLLVLIRAVIFPTSTTHNHHDDNNNNTATVFEAILGDMVFHMQCRFVIGFLTCMTPLPFVGIEAAVVCLSIALQLCAAGFFQ
jgi:hypothetical protein